jgi:ubiquinone biosynthesis protein UbiJ
MLHGALLAALNHLLAGEEWAGKHLKPFAGQTARLEVPPLVVDLAITPEGRFVSADSVSDTPATVTITFPASAPVRLLGGLADPSSLISSAQIQGSADLADCLGFVFRNLRWDVESDLAPLVGDIAARRLVGFGRQIIGWQQQLAGNLARNLAEYFTEERPAITSRRDLAQFSRDVDTVAASLARVERRVGVLEAPRRTR